MRVFYDAEFIEAGSGYPVRLISVGMVRGDGAEYYAVDEGTDWFTITQHPWLRDHVLPSLPVIWEAGVRFDDDHPDRAAVKPRSQIADEVREFILGAPEPQLWADWCAYDHVVLCQLWGLMAGLPDGVPMWTHEFRQEVERAGNPALPSLAGMVEHRALDDARELRMRFDWLAAHEWI